MSLLRRPRRLRTGEALRTLVREHSLFLSDLIYPLFIVHGEQPKEELSSMPGVFRYTLRALATEIPLIQKAGLHAVLLFGVPLHKDDAGTSSYLDPLIPDAIVLIKRLAPEIVIISDICLCSYTSDGHCGLRQGMRIDNDTTLPVLAKMAVSHAQAGVDIVAPSGMMDGMVGAIRQGLDAEHYSNVAIMSYAVKYASSFYGPFREAADCTPIGDRKAYQMDPANAREALREAVLDEQEGADFLMVKPALPYLDIVHRLRERFNLPLAVYQVSGEYSMIKAASHQGWLNERAVVSETLLSMKRAGADLIITYFARDVARWLQGHD